MKFVLMNSVFLSLAIGAIFVVVGCKPPKKNDSNTQGVTFEKVNNHSVRNANVLFSVQQTDDQKEKIGYNLPRQFKCWYLKTLTKPAYDTYSKDADIFRQKVLGTATLLNSYMIADDEIRAHMKQNANVTAVALELFDKVGTLMNFMPTAYTGATKMKLLWQVITYGSIVDSVASGDVENLFVNKTAEEKLAASGIPKYDKVYTQNITTKDEQLSLPIDKLIVQQAIVKAINELEQAISVEKPKTDEFKALKCETAKSVFAGIK